MDEQAVIAGVGGGKTSEDAVAWAAGEAVRRALPLRLVHVVDPLLFATYGRAAAPVYLLEEEERDGAAMLAEAVETATGAEPTVRCEPVGLRGPLVPVLLEAAEDAAVLVLGAHESVLLHATLGPVASHLTNHAPCPVIVVRGPGMPSAARTHVVVGVDGSECSLAAVRFAFEHASALGADLVVVHAAAPPRQLRVQVDTVAMMDDARRWVSESVAGQGELFPDVTVHERVVVSDPVSALVDASHEARLLVVGSHGRGAFRGMLLGSVSHGVLRRADCPVAVVRMPVERTVDTERTEDAERTGDAPVAAARRPSATG